MPRTMQERFEIAKAHQLLRSQEIKNKATRNKIALPNPERDKRPLSTHHRKKYRDYLMTFDKKECGICKKVFQENTRFIHLDHCHTTGDIRGLLCHNCNIGLGCFKDNITFLEAAIEYLLRVDRKTKDKLKEEHKKRVHPSWDNPQEIKPFENNWWSNLPEIWIPFDATNQVN